MTLTFQSRNLGRAIAIAEVHDLGLEDCREFHVELTLAIQAMDDTIQEAHRLDRDAGVPCDRDWLHRTRKKRRITIAFATEAKRRLMKLEGVDGAEVRQRRSLADLQRDKFQRLKLNRLRELLKDELGPGVYEEIEHEAHEDAEGEFKTWLTEEGQEQLYVT
jgi:hypothetical protein